MTSDRSKTETGSTTFEDNGRKSKSRKWVLGGGMGLTVLGIIITIIFWLVPSPYDKTIAQINKSNKTLNEKLTENLSESLQSSTAKDIQKSQIELNSTYELLNDFIKHKKEITTKKYINKLSSVDILKIALDETKQASALNNRIIDDITRNIMPYTSDSSNSVFLMYHHKFDPLLKSYYNQLLKVQANNSQRTIKLSSFYIQLISDTDALQDLADEKHNKELDEYCIELIKDKDYVESIKTWGEFLLVFQEYMEKLKNFYETHQ